MHPHAKLALLCIGLAILALGCQSSATDSASSTASSAPEGEEAPGFRTSPEATTAPAEPTARAEQATPPPPTSTDATPNAGADQIEAVNVVPIGSNVWPLVGALLALDVEPLAIVSQVGRDGAPDYLVERHGPQLEDTPILETNLFDPDIEALAALGGEIFVMPSSFEPLVSEQLLTVMGGSDQVVFVDVLDWRRGLANIAERLGLQPDEVLAPLLETYQTRIDAIRASLNYEPGEVVFSSFIWQDGQILLAPPTTPLVAAMQDVGFALHESAFPDDFETVSFERVLEFDADLVMVQVNSNDDPDFDFETLGSDPLWSLALAAQSGNVFERFQYGTQGGWLEALEVFDDLDQILPLYEPTVST